MRIDTGPAALAAIELLRPRDLFVACVAALAFRRAATAPECGFLRAALEIMISPLRV